MATHKDTYKAVRVHEQGPIENMVMEEVPRHDPDSDQVGIEIEYAGVNFIDTYHRSGLYKIPLPATLGREGAGTVTKVGTGVTKFKVGDKVAFFGVPSYAEYTVAGEGQVFPLPSEMTTQQGAAAAIQGLTAHAFLVNGVVSAKPGDTALIWAALGGTGAMMVQIAKKLGVTTIIGISSKADKFDELRALGCTHVINYKTEDVVEAVQKITNSKGVDYVLDGVGKTTFDTSKKALRKRGTLVAFGNASGAVPPVAPLDLTGSIYLTRPTLFDFAEELPDRCQQLFDWIAGGDIKVRHDKIFNLDEAREAHKHIESGATVGKLLLKTQ
eukprot:Clim_evm86s147 gene=Clim_evmTU86s147